jgi:peptide-methionine (S)-S-oxide reductase
MFHLRHERFFPYGRRIVNQVPLIGIPSERGLEKHLTSIGTLMKNFILLVAMSLSACGGQTQNADSNAQEKVINADPVEIPVQDGIAKAYFASGCFWCVEEIYESVKGVEEVISGYSGGHTENPTYESSNTGRTGHAEAVEVLYNPELVDFATLVDVYFGSQNITQVNGQGPDRGSQYRSILFYQNETQRNIIENKKAELATKLNQPVAAEIYPFQKFWIAEDYHQNYAKNNPNQPYVRGVSLPRFKRFSEKYPKLLKEHEQ